MPLYLFGHCGKEVEVIQGIDKETPLCPECGAKMEKLPTYPAIITMKSKGGIKTHSESYKRDYAKDYRQRLEERKSKTAA